MQRLFSRLPPKVRDSIYDWRTVAVAEVRAPGEPGSFIVYSVSGNKNLKALQTAAEELGIMYVDAEPRVKGRGEVGSPGDAEQILMDATEANSLKIRGPIVASRKVCPDCVAAGEAEGRELVAEKVTRSEPKSASANLPRRPSPASRPHRQRRQQPRQPQRPSPPVQR